MRFASAFLRGLLCFGLLLPLVSACQSQQGAGHNAAAASLDQSLEQSLGNDASPFGTEVDSTGLFDARMKKALGVVLKRSAAPCVEGVLSGSNRPDYAAIEQCMVRNLAASIDESGAAARYCVGSDMEESMNCIFYGLLLHRLRDGDGRTMTAGDWKNAKNSFVGETISLFIDAGMDCAKGMDVENEDSKRCLAGKITERFTGDREIGYPCVKLVQEKFGQCLGEASLTSIVEAASATGI